MAACEKAHDNLSQVTGNTLKILQAFDRMDVPVFKGAASSIIRHEQTASGYHGVDGLGHDRGDFI